jgi:uncharacterized YigZ family protein
MTNNDTYYIPAAKGESVFKDKGSRFIAHCFHCASEDQFKEELQKIKKQYYDARHHVFAYVLLPDQSVFRSSDDGEPAGTGGKPALNQILSAGLTNTAVVVVRYFGGIKLGVSGLIHAYKTAAREAIETAGKKEMTVGEVYLLRFGYPLLNEVMRILKDENTQIRRTDFANSCEIEFVIRKNEAVRVSEKLEKLYGLEIKYLVTI